MLGKEECFPKATQPVGGIPTCSDQAHAVLYFLKLSYLILLNQ